HGVGADHEKLGDLLVRPPGRDPGNHLALPLREPVELWVRRAPGAVYRAEVLDHSPGHGRGQERPALGHGPDRSQDGGWIGVLEQKAAGAEAERFEDVL